MVMISDRPAEAADRAVPGHWEGDLIMGAHNWTAIATLVERSTRYVLLLHLPDGYTPTLVRDALIIKIATLPEQLCRSLTWDQGSEMHLHHQFARATGMPVHFCDPHAPWQRGTNETPTACCARLGHPGHTATRPTTHNQQQCRNDH